MLPLVSVAADGVVRVDKQSAEAIELSTGGRVISLPASAATVQGYTGHVVIDEAAWIPDIDALWMAVVPTISTRGDYRLSVVSTPEPRARTVRPVSIGSALNRHRVHPLLASLAARSYIWTLRAPSLIQPQRRAAGTGSDGVIVG